MTMAKKSKNLSLKEEFRSVLRKSGYKATPARFAVLSIIKQSKNPLSAQGVIERLGTDFDQATVYRTFKSLKESGIIRQIDLRHNHAHYEIANDKEHHHLICILCGRIEDVRECGVEDMHSIILRHSKYFSEIRQHALEFYGICKSCNKNHEN